MSRCRHVNPCLQVLAMSRSGHHAFIEWMIALRGGAAVHHNHCRLGVPAQSHLYQDGRCIADDCRVVPSGAWEIANIENANPALPLPWSCRAVLFMRDVYNCMASRLRAGRSLHLGCWIAQAREALRLTQYIPGLVVVRYDQWRRFARWQQVSRHGRGSSFDGLRKSPSRMQLDQRWQQFTGDPDYRRSVIANDEIRDLNQQLFGWSL